jgi:energy-coupling factor transport system substrate-specific component
MGLCGLWRAADLFGRRVARLADQESAAMSARPTQGRELAVSFAIYGLSTGLGLLAFLYPFLLPSLARGSSIGLAHTDDAPLVLSLLVGLCFLVLLLEIQGEGVSAKFVALLGILVSMNAVLRFVEVAIPGPGGFSPIFFLIVLTGYVYGGRFGFLMGALTLLVSALITGGLGPWLPYQMFTAGWMGLSAPLCRPLVSWMEGQDRRLELIVLALFAGLWGLLYGVIMNVWFWPFAIGPTEQYWQPGIGLGETLGRYAAFYLATSLVWDVVRALSNGLLMLAFGAPTLRALRRFKRRFAFTYHPEASACSTEPGLSPTR